MDARLIVGKNVARLRAARGISQTQLADRIDPAKLHMDQSYISKLEGGRKNVTILTMSVLAAALAATLGDLVADIE